MKGQINKSKTNLSKKNKQIGSKSWNKNSYDLLKVLGTNDTHIREILNAASKQEEYVKALQLAINFYKERNIENKNLIKHLETLEVYYNENSSYEDKINAGNYLMSPLPKYVNSPEILEINSGMNIQDIKLNVGGNLLPRLKTLSMGEYVINNLVKKNCVIIDIGTGSGALPLFILQQDKNHFVDKAIGYDLEYSISIEGNANSQIQKQIGGISTWKGIEKNLIEKNILPNKKIIIIGNLPYGNQKDFEKYPNRVKKEPIKALIGGGEDGLDIYREYLKGISNSPYIKDILGIIFEGGSGNIKILYELAKKSFPNHSVTILKDCFGKDRFIQIKK